MNILLVGKTGSGKSSTGNTLLEQKIFQVRKRGFPNSFTVFPGVGKTSWNSQDIVIYDTPGLMDTGFNDRQSLINTFDDVEMVLKRCQGGVHAFLIVISTSEHFSNEDRTVLRYLKTIFGTKELIDRGILVFTHGETHQSLEDWCKGQRPELKVKDIFEEFSNGTVLISNEQDRERYRNELLQKVTQGISVKTPYKLEDFKKYSKNREQLLNKYCSYL